MSKAEMLYRIIESIIFLIPIGTIIYKLGKTSERIGNHETRIKKCEQRIEDINDATKANLTEIMATLNDIKVSIARLEERLEHVDKKQNK